MSGRADPTAEVVELLQQLIRNACVNDGRAESGQEWRNADLLGAYLGAGGLDLERFEPAPGRVSVAARIEGRDPTAPSLLLMGHTDVVPASPDRWREDPYGGELIDGWVWGRGAVDMLNLTASMAVAVRRLAHGGFAPKGTLTFLAVADEEALGAHGAGWLTEHRPDAVRADYVVTEFGGFPFSLHPEGGRRLPVMVAEKGASWLSLRVSGSAGHASMPLHADNALVKAADVVRRLAGYRPPATMTEAWRGFVDRAGLPEDVSAALLDPDRVGATVESLTDPGLAGWIHSCTHTTIAPTIVRGGVKTNVIPDRVELQVDVRTLPGQAMEDVRRMLEEALGDLSGEVEIVADADNRPTASPVDTPLWDSLQRAAAGLVPGAENVPLLLVTATDARFFRSLGSTAYGYGLYSDRIPAGEFLRMFHGDDERVDVESLRLSTELWERVAADFLT